MPFQSKAQMRKFGAMKARGEISKEEFARWVAETKKAGGFAKLPEKKKKKKKKGSTREKYFKMISKK